MDDQDEDVCRICAAPGDIDQPLFHPCKCSGTIRYIHQECLATWLAHSKKTTCDVCKHKFAFTKVYAPNMPRRLPIVLFLRRFSLQLSAMGLLALRGALVGMVWLAMLPYSTVWTWRFFFWSGDSLAWFIAGRQPPYFNFNTTAITNTTTEAINSTSIHLPKQPLRPILRTLSSDIFTGQIITSVIVLLFLSGFLLREWIFQNAPADNLAVPEADQPAEEPAREIVPPVVVEIPAEVAAAALPREATEDEVFEQMMEIQDEIDGRENIDEMDDDDDLPPVDSFALETRLPQPEELDEFFPLLEDADEQDDSAHSVDSMAEEEDDMDDTPSLVLPASTSRQTESEMSFEDVAAGPSTSSAPEVLSLPSHSPETSDWQAVENHLASSPGLKRKASSSASSRPSGSTSEVWSNVLIDGKPKVKRRKTVIEHDRASAHNPHSSDASADAGPSQARGVKRIRDGEDSAEESAVRERRDSVRMRAAREETVVYRTRRTPTIRPATPWRNPKTLIDSSDTDNEHETDSTDQGKVNTFQPVENGETPRAKEKAKERAPPPPRITLDLPETSPAEMPASSSLISPSRMSPRRPGLPPALPTPIRRLPHRHVEDATTPGSSSSTGRRKDGESPGRAFYRPPEDMDYFGDVEETDLSANDVPRRNSTMSEGDGQELLVPPERDLTLNVANPIEDPVPPPPPQAPEEPLAVDEPLPQILMNNENDAIAGAGEEDARDAVDDDMDGALEAVGMRGPIHQLFQNVALMMCLLDVFIGAAVFLPFIIGKSAALLSLDHRRTLLIINLPIKLIRFFTDPVVDMLAIVIRAALIALGRVLAPPPVRAVAIGLGKLFLRALRTVFPRRAPVTSASSVLKTMVWPRVNNTIQTYSASAIAYFDSAFDAHPSAEESFATLGAFISHIKPHLKDLRATYNQEFRHFVERDTVISRTYAMMLGYSLIAAGLGVWMQSVRQERIKGFAKTLRNVVHQQLLVAKVAFFIVSELVLFPLGCGIVLDLCAMPLFPDTTVMKRVAFGFYAPITSVFIHWTLGTMFMFQFAMLLDGCRKIMRPGALWFIRDPQDPQFSPIQDILGRPATSQLRKLLISAVMYCFVVFGGLGSVIWFMRHFRPFQGFLPLRWDMHEPLSEVPIDLLFLHVVVPATVKQLRIRVYVKEVATLLWRNLSARLRLTSYMFGERHHEEEVPRSLRLFFGAPNQPDDSVALEPDGGLYRVPANDHIMLVPRTRVIIPLDQEGLPIDDAARERMERQDEEATKHGRNPQDDYSIVYLPPHFGRRVVTFMILIWMYGMAGVVFFIAAPTLTGRLVLDRMLGREVHDGYAFGVGFHLLAVTLYLAQAVYGAVARKPTLTALQSLAYRSFAGTVWLMKLIYLMLVFYGVFPLLAGIALELHVVLPVKFAMHPLRIPIFHIVENWAAGVVLCQIAARLLRLRRALMIELIDEARANNWANPQAWRLTKHVIFPLIMTGIAANALPAYVARSVVRLGFFKAHPVILYRMIYPFWIMTLCQTILLLRLFDLIGLWVQTVRDKEFLVELRLRNLEN